MERRNDPYLSEAVIKLLAETSDIDDESDDTDADKTYQPSREDLESSYSDCDLEKVIKEKSPVNLINCGDGDVLCQPSTSTEGGLQQVDVENSESVKKQKKFTKDTKEACNQAWRKKSQRKERQAGQTKTAVEERSVQQQTIPWAFGSLLIAGKILSIRLTQFIKNCFKQRS